MILIVGLGNPGKKFQKTPHNLGFLALDKFQKESDFPAFSFSKKFISEISERKIANEKIILAKPRTFMNSSGVTVKKLIKNLKLKIKNLIVIHDDIDLPLGKFRISADCGSAGHKGVESIIQELKTKNFARFRIGIQPKTGKPKNIKNFVLQKFNKEEEKIVKEVIEKMILSIEFFLKEGLEKQEIG